MSSSETADKLSKARQSGAHEDPASPDWFHPIEDKPGKSGWGGCYLPLILLGGILASIGLLQLALWSEGTISTPMLVVFGLLSTAGLLLVAVLFVLTKRDLVQPLAILRHWAMRIRAGHLSARVPEPGRGNFQRLATDINALSSTFEALSLDMEAQVEKQTERIQHKTRSLEILYDVAASINSSRDVDDLLRRFLHTLKEVAKARAATVRLLTDNDQMRLVASIGLDETIVEREQFIPAQQCLCGQAATDGRLAVRDNLGKCGKVIGTQFFGGSEDIEMIVVPLQYRHRTLGVYNLFVPKNSEFSSEDDRDLLISIGRHLGMAIEKASVDEEANRLTIIEERTRIAHELHDSLAQTLASLRFQVRVLDETLHQGDESALWQELERIENSLDEAYTELRGLIDHFRAPIDRRGLVPAIEKLVQRFRHESNILIFLQQEWSAQDLPEETEIQILRIVQEALTNVRKHSQAHTVRVLLRSDSESDQYSVLIEDDGVGIPQQRQNKGGPGEHVGLSIMKERAHRVGGELRIESESGEGTRILLNFTTAPQEGSIHVPFHGQMLQ